MGAQDNQVRRPAGGRLGGAQLARRDPDGAEAVDRTERGCKVRFPPVFGLVAGTVCMLLFVVTSIFSGYYSPIGRAH